MKADHAYRMASPPREYAGRVYGYNIQTGETVLPRTSTQQAVRPTSQGQTWDSARGGQRNERGPEGQGQGTRFYPDMSRQPLSAPRHGVSAYPDSPYFSQPPQTSHIETLSNQVASLEDRVARLTSVLNDERVDTVRAHLETTAYMVQMLSWIGGHDGEFRLPAPLCKVDR